MEQNAGFTYKSVQRGGLSPASADTPSSGLMSLTHHCLDEIFPQSSNRSPNTQLRTPSPGQPLTEKSTSSALLWKTCWCGSCECDSYQAAGSYSAQTRMNSSRWWGPRMEASRVRYSKLSMMTATNKFSIWKEKEYKIWQWQIWQLK